MATGGYRDYYFGHPVGSVETVRTQETTLVDPALTKVLEDIAKSLQKLTAPAEPGDLARQVRRQKVEQLIGEAEADALMQRCRLIRWREKGSSYEPTREQLEDWVTEAEKRARLLRELLAKTEAAEGKT